MDEKKVDILYFIEHIPREFDISCLVKNLLEHRNKLSVKIVSLPLHRPADIEGIEPRCVVLPYMYDTRNPLICTLIKKFQKAVFVNLNFEQLFSKANQNFKAPKTPEVKNIVFQYCWGKPFEQFLLEHGVKASNIYIGGNPSFTLYQSPYRDFFKSRNELAKEFGLDRNKKWIFFPENYAWAFLTFGQIISRIRSGFRVTTAIENRLFNLKSVRSVIRWLGEISAQGEYEVIVRPRPAISSDEYTRVIKKTLGLIPSSLHVIKDGTIREWNIASDVIVSSYSTSLLEASVLKKPVYILEPYEFTDSMQAEFISLIPHIRTLKEFRSAIARPDTESYQKARNFLLRNYFCPDSIEKIGSVIKRAVDTSTDERYWFANAKNLSCKTQVAKQISDADQKARFSNDYFTQSDIKKNCAKWLKVQGRKLV